MKYSDWISLGSVVIATFALVYTYISNTKKYELASQYRREVLTWYSYTLEILIRLRAEIKDGQPNAEVKKELLAKLSSQIEIGRFYFPNVDKGDNFGTEKPSAYRGYRNLMLDFLVFSYSIFDKRDAHRYIRHAETLQRHFTSHLFETLNPRKFLKDTSKYTKNVFTKDLRFEDFIEQDPDNIKYYYEAS